MSKQTKLNVNLKPLEELRKQIGNTYVTRVGVLGNGVTRINKGEAISNAELLLIQMFGSVSRNIPPRDPLMMPLQLKKKELLQSLNSAEVKKALENEDYKAIYNFLGKEAIKIIQEAFATRGYGQWKENAPSTIRQKKSDMPLINIGELRKSISFDVVKKSRNSKGSIGTLNL